MKHRNLDVNGDWTFGKGLQDYAKDQNAILLNVKTRLQSWKGDCFFALTEGVDYNNLLETGTKALLDSDIKRVILQSEGILRIDSYESALNGESREFQVYCGIETIYGKTFIDEGEKVISENETVLVYKTVPDGTLKTVPSGAFKLTFVRRIDL